jgi:hypothetical protein
MHLLSDKMWSDLHEQIDGEVVDPAVHVKFTEAPVQVGRHPPFPSSSQTSVPATFPSPQTRRQEVPLRTNPG